MRYLLEYSSFYKIGDYVLINYWYNNMITPCIIVGKVNNKFLISHNIKQSNIRNAPDELLKNSDIIDHLRK
jgi:hypothetical protein